MHILKMFSDLDYHGLKRESFSVVYSSLNIYVPMLVINTSNGTLDKASLSLCEFLARNKFFVVETFVQARAIK